MAHSWNDLQRLKRSQSRQGLLIEFDDAEIGAADDQKSGACTLLSASPARSGARRARPLRRCGKKLCRCDQGRRRSMLAPNSPSGSFATNA